MKQIGVGIIGTGWCGGIRAQTCAASPLVKSLHLAEILPERLAEVAGATGARTAVTDYRELVANSEIDALYISATPETTHYPMAHDCLAAGKHVFLENRLRLRLPKPTSSSPRRANASLSSPSATRSGSIPSLPTSGNRSAMGRSAGR